MHSLSAYFIDYICMDPQMNVDGMLDDRKRSLARENASKVAGAKSATDLTPRTTVKLG